MRIYSLAVSTAALALTACAATPLQYPAAAEIIVTRNAPPPECRFVGEVRGSQGSVWTADFTRDEDLVIGARNKMRDNAFALGGNYVQLELENPSHNTGDHSSGGVYASTVIGNAYRCPSSGRTAVSANTQPTSGSVTNRSD